MGFNFFFFFSSRRRHTRLQGDWSSDVCSSDLPVSCTAPPEELSDTDLLRDALPGEIGHVRMWYDLAVTRCGRTTVGVSRLTPEEMGTFIGACLDGYAPPPPRSDIPVAALGRFAVED